MAGKAGELQTAGAAGNHVVIECIYANGRFPKLLVSDSRPKGLKFTNGRAVVTKEDVRKLMENKALWGRQIDLYGKLRLPGRVRLPEVVRGVGQTIAAGGGPPPPTDAQTGKPIESETVLE